MKKDILSRKIVEEKIKIAGINFLNKYGIPPMLILVTKKLRDRLIEWYFPQSPPSDPCKSFKINGMIIIVSPKFEAEARVLKNEFKLY